MKLDKDIIQIQQWLTDVSATRAAEGFDGGYKEAASFNESITAIVREHQNELDFSLGEINRIQINILKASIVLGVIALIASVTLSYLVSRSVLKPLLMFKGKFAQGASGDLTVHVDYHKDNEIGDISKSFNIFSSSLKDLTVTLKSNIVEMKEHNTLFIFRRVFSNF